MISKKPVRNSVLAFALVSVAALLGAVTPAAAEAKAPKCFGKAATVIEPDERNRITGTNGEDILYSGVKNVRIYARSGNDLVCAPNAAQLWGGAGDDGLLGGAGQDRLFGEEGNDELLGGAARDQLQAGPDADVLEGGDGSDHMEGERGDDELLGDPQGSAGANDHLLGGGGTDTISGGGRNDYLYDGSGPDRVEGGPGDDRVFTGSDGAADAFTGDEGSDRIWFGYAKVGLRISLDDVANDGRGCPQQCEGDNVGSSFERIQGSDHDDTLIGDANANRILGAFGNDVIDGGAGDDSLRGNAGDDSIDGGTEVDECHGNQGVDSGVNCESLDTIP